MHGTLIAPYYKQRPTQFYDGLFIGGTYTLDLMGCLAEDELVWTLEGLRPINTIEEGDEIIGGDAEKPAQLARLRGLAIARRVRTGMVSVNGAPQARPGQRDAKHR